MGNNKTLHLPSKKDPLEVILMDETPEQAEYNSTLLVPTSRDRHDYSHLPPPGERGAFPVQVAPKTWGNPRLLGPGSARPGPQPAHTPPRGR